MSSPLLQLTLARIREFYREPAALFWVYGFPLLLALGLGAAFRDRPVEQISIDIVGTEEVTAPVVEQLSADKRVKITIHDEAVARNRLRVAKTDLVIVPAAGGPDRHLFDPNRPEGVLARNAAENAALRAVANSVPRVTEEPVVEPGSRYIDFLIPGLIGTNLMGGGLFGIGFVVVDMRVRKLLKRFLATPMRKRDFLLSLMLSRLMFTLIEMILFVTFARLIYDIRVRGQFLAFLALVTLGGFAFSGLGLLIASRAKTTETVSGLMNAAMLPMYVLSGVFFSWEKFPEVVHPLIRLLPLTALNDGLRAVMNDGVGIADVLREIAILGTWTAVTSAIALRVFRWR